MSEQEAEKRHIPWVTIGIVGVVAAICVTNFARGDEPEDMTSQAEDNCHTWVSEKLKAPATASFTTTSSAGSESGPWTMSGTVDAENSFGAKIRNEWECEISLTDGVFTGRTRVL